VHQICGRALKVPVFVEKYWTTFPDRSGARLARTLAVARANPPRAGFPQIEKLDRDTRIRIEEENVVKCLAYAVGRLGMGR
jgi:3-oxoisoapionate decarboxylase